MVRNPYQLVGAVALSLGAGVIGSLATTPAIPTWYAALEKPFFNPPNWVFAPVWTTLYFLMGVSLYLIMQAKQSPRRVQTIRLFAAQLALNALWSLVFFGAKEPGAALLVIAILFAVLVELIRQTAHLDRRAAWLLAPYLIWVSFASVLNLAIWRLN